MVVRGHVQNGVVVLDDGTRLPERQTVTVLTPTAEEQSGPYPVSQERREAALALIGMLKTDQPPPSDEEVEKIIEEEIMKKYG